MRSQPVSDGASPAGRTSPAAIRARCRSGELTGPTSGLAPGFAQANLVALPREQEEDFRRFCERNPRPCPLLEVSRTPVLRGSGSAAPGADLRTDLPRYRTFADGELLRETEQVVEAWTEDLTAFLLGCSFGFESALVEAGIRLRHQDENRNVPVYATNRATRPAGPFAGPLLVSMRPVPADRVEDAVAISAEFPLSHGAPIHVGDPAVLGIADFDAPDFGDSGGLLPGEVPLFWACGVTSQIVARAARPARLITHASGHMLVTDTPVARQRVRSPFPPTDAAD